MNTNSFKSVTASNSPFSSSDKNVKITVSGYDKNPGPLYAAAFGNDDHGDNKSDVHIVPLRDGEYSINADGVVLMHGRCGWYSRNKR